MLIICVAVYLYRLWVYAYTCMSCHVMSLDPQNEVLCYILLISFILTCTKLPLVLTFQQICMQSLRNDQLLACVCLIRLPCVRDVAHVIGFYSGSPSTPNVCLLLSLWMVIPLCEVLESWTTLLDASGSWSNYCSSSLSNMPPDGMWNGFSI